MRAVTEGDYAEFRTTLATVSAASGQPLTEAQLDQCAEYTRLVLATNEHTNLTRITAPREIAVKHFADSLTLLPYLPRTGSLADVGTGAGFPGLVIKIARPELRVTLLDSLQKRLTFLAEVAAELNLDGVDLRHSRAEDAGRTAPLRDRFDIVTARAVAALPTLLEWCGPLVKPRGIFIAMKAGGVDEELDLAANAANCMRLRLKRDVALTLPVVPGSDEPPAERRLLVFEKVAPTPVMYPRIAAEIKRHPL